MARTAVVAGTATAVSNRVSRRQANRWAEQDQQQAAASAQAGYPPTYPPPQQYQQQPSPYQEPPPAAPPAPAPVVVVQQSQSPDMDAKLTQLQQLAELKAQGVLSDAEFEAQKQRVLNS
jgi:hypothetical protein